MSAPKRALDDEAAAAAAAGGVGGAPPPPAHLLPPPADDDDAFERRLKLTDIIGFVALNGYAREADACAGLNRETWRCIPAGLSAADADHVRRDHPLWQAIIDLKHGQWRSTRLDLAAIKGRLSCVRELCDWRADIEAADNDGRTPLWYASSFGRLDVVRELLARGANVNAATNFGTTSLMHASWRGHVEVVRALLAAGADKRRMTNNAHTATSLAGKDATAPPGSRAAILALLAAAP
jgi:hypothetical protein